MAYQPKEVLRSSPLLMFSCFVAQSLIIHLGHPLVYEWSPVLYKKDKRTFDMCKFRILKYSTIQWSISFIISSLLSNKTGVSQHMDTLEWTLSYLGHIDSPIQGSRL